MYINKNKIAVRCGFHVISDATIPTVNMTLAIERNIS